MRIPREARQLSKQLFKMSFVNGRLDRGRVATVVESMLTSKPRNYMAVLENYKKLIRLEEQKRHVIVESAAPLSTEVQAVTLERLMVKYGRDLTSEFRVNPELLGGLRIKIGSDVWDGSVRNRLATLEQQL